MKQNVLTLCLHWSNLNHNIKILKFQYFTYDSQLKSIDKYHLHLKQNKQLKNIFLFIKHR